MKPIVGIAFQFSKSTLVIVLWGLKGKAAVSHVNTSISINTPSVRSCTVGSQGSAPSSCYVCWVKSSRLFRWTDDPSETSPEWITRQLLLTLEGDNTSVVCLPPAWFHVPPVHKTRSIVTRMWQLLEQHLNLHFSFSPNCGLAPHILWLILNFASAKNGISSVSGSRYNRAFTDLMKAKPSARYLYTTQKAQLCHWCWFCGLWQ